MKSRLIIILCLNLNSLDSALGGDFKKCSEYGELCLPMKKDPCCDPGVICVMQPSSSHFRCTERDRIGEVCNSQLDCKTIQYAECSLENECVCKKNYVPVGPTECRPNLNEFCQENECFPVNSVCIDSKCQCREKFFSYQSKLCLPVSRKNYSEVKSFQCAPTLGGFCALDSDCEVTLLRCIDNKCQCRYEKKSRWTTECRQPLIATACISDYQCSEIVKNSQCTNGKCGCLMNFILENEACLPGIGEVCPDDRCGVDNSHCIDNKCQCRHGYEFDNKKCRLVNTNVDCNRDEDCDNAFCQGGRCRCRSRFMSEDNRCVRLDSKICFSKNQCKIINSECIENECQCRSETLISPDMCLPSKLGQFCTKDSHCLLIINAVCSKKKRCVCQSTFLPASPIACQSFLKGFCRDINDCPLDNFACIDNKCECIPGFLPLTSRVCVNVNAAMMCNRRFYDDYQNTTLPAKNLGSYCINATFCGIPKSDCIDHKCQCKEYFTSAGDKCIETQLGRKCSENSDCRYIKNGECSSDKICACIYNYSRYSKYECVPNLGAACNNSTECHVYASDCIDGVCQCKPDFSPVSRNQCELTSSLVVCIKDLDCAEPWHFKCLAGRCVCRINNVARGKWSCQPTLNGYCWKDDQCVTNDSKCIDFRCQCRKSLVPLDNYLCIPPE